MYDLTIEELKGFLGEKFPKSQKFPTNLAIDLVALQATRLQIDLLMDDVRDYNNRLDQSRQMMAQLRMDATAEMDQIHVHYRSEIHSMQENVISLNKALQKVEAEKLKMLSDFASKQAQWEAGLLTPRRIEAKYSAIESNKSDAIKKLVKFQATIRGFLARSRVRRAKLKITAKQSGVLVALDPDHQGESGWYSGPNGMIYYFVLDNVSIDYLSNRYHIDTLTLTDCVDFVGGMDHDCWSY